MVGEPSAIAGRVTREAAVPEVVRAYFDALNAEDWDRLEAVWTDTAELRAVGSRPRHGRDEIMAYFRPLFRPWARHLDRPTRWIVAEDTVIAEVTFTGSTHDRQELTFDAVDVFDLTDGAIARLTTWYDLTWVRRQLS